MCIRDRPYIHAKMGVTIKGDVERVVWARLLPNGIVLPLSARPLVKSHLLRANCFVIVKKSVKKGESVRAYLPPGLFSNFTLMEWAEQDMQGS